MDEPESVSQGARSAYVTAFSSADVSNWVTASLEGPASHSPGTSPRSAIIGRA
jgi:hypothetical protein